MIALVRAALQRYRKDPPPRITVAMRDYLIALPEINDLISNKVFASRVPKKEKPAIAVKLSRISVARNNDLAGESQMVASTVQVDVMSRLPGAERRVEMVAEMIRIATAGVSYRGYWGNLWIYGATVERDAMQSPLQPIDASNNWQFQYSMDLRINHTQSSPTED